MYKLVPTKYFIKQLEELGYDARRILEEKLGLVKINPFRFKRIKGYSLFLFRIRFSDQRKEKRLIFMIDNAEVILVCILDRKKEYLDLKKYLEGLNY